MVQLFFWIFRASSREKEITAFHTMSAEPLSHEWNGSMTVIYCIYCGLKSGLEYCINNHITPDQQRELETNGKDFRCSRPECQQSSACPADAQRRADIDANRRA